MIADVDGRAMSRAGRYSERLLLSHWSSWSDVLLSSVPPDTPHASGCKPLPSLPMTRPGSINPSMLGAGIGLSSHSGGGLQHAQQQQPARSPPQSARRGVVSGEGIDEKLVGAKQPAARTSVESERERDRPPSNTDGKAPAREKEAKEKESKDLLKLSGRTVPGMTMRKVASLSALPSRPNDVRVRVHKTREVTNLLPKSVRDLRLVLLVPRQVRDTWCALVCQRGWAFRLSQGRLRTRPHARRPCKLGREIHAVPWAH